MSEADARFEEALRADLQRHLGGSLRVRRLSLRPIADGYVEVTAVVRADNFDLRFQATGETAVEAYGRLVADGHAERLPRGERNP